MKKKFIWVVVVFVTMVCDVSAQTTEFSYQGSLKNGSAAANGNFDFEFRVYDAVSGGSQVGALATRTNVAVENGLFAVKLDFGTTFSGADRFLEIRVRSAGGGGYTILDPRQRVGSSPYAVKSLTTATADNATQLGGVTAAGFIQNTNSTQAASNFNISGNGTAGGTLAGDIINATTQYNIGGVRVLSTLGNGNAFAGRNAGQTNTGQNNSFFGNSAGTSNTGGSSNAFFGSCGGCNNMGGNQNSFFGSSAGNFNMTGNANSFVGYFAGKTNMTGSNNSAIGHRSDVASDDLSFATAIGSEAVVSTSNTIVLGRSNGSDTVRIPGKLVIGDILGIAGATSLCRNISNQISTCSSSLRYKTNISSFGYGLNLVKQLRPITFDWKDGGMHDLGLGAEDVAEIEPLLVTYNKEGEVEGVKYDRIGVLLINAVKEQQVQIEAQKAEIEMLKAAIYEINTTSAFCKK